MPKSFGVLFQKNCHVSYFRKSLHKGLQLLVRDLNRLYCGTAALHGSEFEWQGFEWIDCHDSQQSVLTFLRRCGDECLVVVANLTPVPRHGYRIGLPQGGFWREVMPMPFKRRSRIMAFDEQQ